MLTSLPRKRAVCVCVCNGGMGAPVPKPLWIRPEYIRPLSLKVCQRVHGGRRPSKSTIMGFNAFHLRKGRKACGCTCCVERAQQHINSWLNSSLGEDYGLWGETPVATSTLKQRSLEKPCFRLKTPGFLVSVWTCSDGDVWKQWRRHS